MKITSQRNYLVNLESVAMTDIVLNMFIFFFISFSLLYTFSPGRLQKLGVNLAKVKNAQAVENTKPVNISINKEGIVYLEKEAVTIEELNEEIGTFRAKNSELSILLHTDKAAEFRYVAKVLDLLSSLNISNINIAVTPERK